MSPVVEVIAPRLLGPAVIVAVALVVKGYAAVGDGFAAGGIVALAVALRYVALGVDRAERSLPILRHSHLVAAAGLLLALAAGFFPLALGEPPFTHLPRPGEHVVKLGMLELMTPVAFDVALFLLVSGSLVTVLDRLARVVDEERP